MAIDDLLAKVIGGFVESPNGNAKEVKYNRTMVRAIPEFVKIEAEDKKTISSRVTFHGMKLTTEPKTGDIITWDGDKYHHEHHVKDYGLYDVTATISRNKRGRH